MYIYMYMYIFLYLYVCVNVLLQRKISALRKELAELHEDEICAEMDEERWGCILLCVISVAFCAFFLLYWLWTHSDYIVVVLNTKLGIKCFDKYRNKICYGVIWARIFHCKNNLYLKLCKSYYDDPMCLKLHKQSNYYHWDSCWKGNCWT